LNNALIKLKEFYKESGNNNNKQDSKLFLKCDSWGGNKTYESTILVDEKNEPNGATTLFPFVYLSKFTPNQVDLTHRIGLASVETQNNWCRKAEFANSQLHLMHFSSLSLDPIYYEKYFKHRKSLNAKYPIKFWVEILSNLCSSCVVHDGSVHYYAATLKVDGDASEIMRYMLKGISFQYLNIIKDIIKVKQNTKNASNLVVKPVNKNNIQKNDVTKINLTKYKNIIASKDQTIQTLLKIMKDNKVMVPHEFKDSSPQDKTVVIN
jgi:hypothetical protein